MRWLIVSRQHHASHGGIGASVQRFLQAARAAGWHVELITQPGHDWPPCARVHEVHTADLQPGFEERVADLRRRNVIRPYRYALWSQAVAQRLLTVDNDFDAIEFVDCQAEGFAALGSAAVRERHRGAVMFVQAHTPMWIEETINGCDATAFGRGLYHGWERRAISLADGVFTCSNILARALGVLLHPAIIPYPIRSPGDVKPQDRAERILLVGSVQLRKGVDVWARSLNQVLRNRPRAHAELTGPDTPTAPDGLSMAAHVQRLIDPRLLDRFQWRGALPHDQVQQRLAEAALVVVPSRLESFSLVAAEALLAGTPVIVSDQVGIAEHVPSLKRVAAENAEELAAAQIEALSDRAAAMHAASAARIELLTACNPDRVLSLRRQLVVRSRGRRLHHAAIEGDALSELGRFIDAVDEASDSISCEPVAAE